MTVSKALRDKPDISTATKARIRRLVEKMGYVPDSAATSLRSRTSRLLGVIIPGVTDPIYARVLTAIEQQAHELGYDLILNQSLGSVEREETALRRLLARRVDGLLLAPVHRLEPHTPAYDELLQRGIPAVVLGHRSAFCAKLVAVEIDDMGASAAATRHLLELGHRRIAFLAGPLAAPWATERLEGYRRALREAGVPIDDRLIFHAGSTIEEGARSALQLIQEQPGATALQGANDLVAIGAANLLLNQGVRIPQDLSVVGFGNVLVSEYFRVPLTTIRQPKFRLGAVAMETLVKLIRGEPTETKRLPAELIIRASSGPVGPGRLNG